MAGGVHRRQGGGGGVVAARQEAARPAAGKSVPPEALASMTKEQLRVECRRRGQKASGNKVELLARLGYYKLTAQASPPAPAAADPPPEPRDTRRHAHKNGDPRPPHAAGKDIKNKAGAMDPENGLVLWKRPLTTLEYFGREMIILCSVAVQRLMAYKAAAASLLLLCALTACSHSVDGPHRPYLQSALATLLWWGWWVLLGVLSSVGLGTGLHTFLLYLGPHIAKVTLAAYECGAVNFPEPPYPTDIICPDTIDPRYAVSIWNIMAKVRIESMMWGLGTALGELPPYFMARAARLSGGGALDELEVDDKTFSGRAKMGVQRLVERVGFLGILACASIPNPLFDLAGLTCGHFLVPFWTFFGATLLGKAVVKMHIQKMFVIVAFNETLIGQALSWVEKIPYVGPRLEEPLLEFLRNQKKRLHKSDASAAPETQGSLLSNLLEKFVLAMVVYFVVSIVNSLAQSYQARITKGRKSSKQKE